MRALPPGSLVVSCQSIPGDPFDSAELMALMARAAELGGAAAIRANGPEHIAAIRAVTTLPIIGIHKVGDPSGVFITPTFEAAAGVVAAGADLIALDATLRPRPDGRSLSNQIGRIHTELGVPILADVDTFGAGVAARAAGADLVATTLSGYTDGSTPTGPDVDLVRRLAAAVDCPVVAEGRIRTPEDVRAVFDAGAHAVVVGSAITNPTHITAHLASALPPKWSTRPHP
ncbi:N-acetylmannosamine-6-phosphate 2-epimerase [Kribbella sp. NPDC050820]|uniref:N-acetylmannosamine-6-phosphate 2-epimerase n=1 Tax=Kribbella sp. NPDC050820 TaxID=3155408 RepID=UPI0033F590B8